MFTRRAMGCVLLLVSGCGATGHGPAARVVSTTTHMQNTVAGDVQKLGTGGGMVDRETVQESRLSDAEGREWTETKIVKTERVSMSQIEAELYEEALRKSEGRSTE